MYSFLPRQGLYLATYEICIAEQHALPIDYLDKFSKKEILGQYTVVDKIEITGCVSIQLKYLTFVNRY